MNVIYYARDTWSIYDIFFRCTTKRWKQIFTKYEKEIQEISDKLKNEVFYPEKHNLLNSFLYTNFNKVRVVILGQDPYYNLDKYGNIRACGLAFSSNNDIPSSLRNIFKECGIHSNNGNLINWAKQGILLLNMALTVKPNKPNSHSKIWFNFTISICKEIYQHNNKVIFVLWGKEAQSLLKYLPNIINLCSSHPSGLSANKGFFGCDHFNKINNMLDNMLMKKINWEISTD